MFQARYHWLEQPLFLYELPRKKQEQLLIKHAINCEVHPNFLTQTRVPTCQLAHVWVTLITKLPWTNLPPFPTRTTPWTQWYLWVDHGELYRSWTRSWKTASEKYHQSHVTYNEVGVQCRQEPAQGFTSSEGRNRIWIKISHILVPVLINCCYSEPVCTSKNDNNILITLTFWGCRRI